MLEERAELSQTLRDKLGHNINGSVYQPEAVKVLLEKEPEVSRKMVQAVIDQLRTGMEVILDNAYEAVSNSMKYTVEGNSGDSCKLNSYALGSSVIYGYGCPAY